VDAADRLIAKLFEAFEELARIPGMGHKRGSHPVPTSLLASR